MVTLNELKAKRGAILDAASRHGASHVRIFGSIVRNAGTKQSDVDFLIELDSDRSLIDRVALMQELEELLESKVDVVNERALHPSIRNQVLCEAVEL